MKVDILGTEYTVEYRKREDDNFLNNNRDGYCDKTVKLIVVEDTPKETSLGDYDVYKKTVMRHEIIHAFLFESGLHECFLHTESGHDETYVDWIATQFPKILEVYKKVGCL